MATQVKDTWPTTDEIGATERHVEHYSPHHFRCPYCYKTWERHGSKEGFVKAAAASHVFSCYQLAVYAKGYVLTWEYRKYQRIVAPVDEAPYPEHIKLLKRLQTRRRREQR